MSSNLTSIIPISKLLYKTSYVENVYILYCFYFFVIKQGDMTVFTYLENFLEDKSLISMCKTHTSALKSANHFSFYRTLPNGLTEKIDLIYYRSV